MQESVRELFDLTAAGDLKAINGSSYALAQAADAHFAMEKRLTFGKVVLVA